MNRSDLGSGVPIRVRLRDLGYLKGLRANLSWKRGWKSWVGPAQVRVRLSTLLTCSLVSMPLPTNAVLSPWTSWHECKRTCPVITELSSSIYRLRILVRSVHSCWHVKTQRLWKRTTVRYALCKSSKTRIWPWWGCISSDLLRTKGGE